MVSMGGSRQGQTQTQSLSRFDPNTAQSKAYMGQVEPRAEAIGEPVPFELPDQVVNPIDASAFFDTTKEAIMNPLSNLEINKAQQQLLQLTRDKVLGDTSVRGLKPTESSILQAVAPALVQMGQGRATGLTNLAAQVVQPQQQTMLEQRGQDIDALLSQAGLSTGREQSALNAYLDLVALSQEQPVVLSQGRGWGSGSSFGISDRVLKTNIKPVVNAMEILNGN